MLHKYETWVLRTGQEQKEMLFILVQLLGSGSKGRVQSLYFKKETTFKLSQKVG